MGDRHGVCPWQAGSVLTGSLRRRVHNPRRILEPYMKDGMTAMDIGCGMGFFTLPMADLVGDRGKVIAVDLQPQMLYGLTERAAHAGIGNIVANQCNMTTLSLDSWNGTVDFALIFWVLHEVPDPERLIGEVRSALSAGGSLLFVEPCIHVGAKEFQKSVDMIARSGFAITHKPRIAISRAALFEKC